MLTHRIEEAGSISVATVKDGSLHRHVVHPGDDVSSESEEVQKLAQEIWTQEVIDEWERLQAQSEIDSTLPESPKTYTAEQLFDLFEAEYDVIYEASKTNKDAAFFFDKLRTRNRPIRADNPKLKQGLDLYVSLGLIAREKADSIVDGSA